MSRKGMDITTLPTELLNDVLLRAVFANKRDGVHFTYGLLENSQFPVEPGSPRLTKYVRSPLGDEPMTVDAAWSIRRVCRRWGDWAMLQSFRTIREQFYPGRRRWADLTPCRSRYPLYELIENPRGTIVYRDPYGSLRKTHELFDDYPVLSQHVRRLWFNGFHAAATDKRILSIVEYCYNLESLTIPWTILRRGTAEDWANVLKTSMTPGKALQSLEIRSFTLATDDESCLGYSEASTPLKDPRVSFEGLHRLRLSGDASQMAISDDDLVAIARTATNLRSIQITGSATISASGVLALVKSSSSNLELLEYRPLPGAFCQSPVYDCSTSGEAENPSEWIFDRHPPADSEARSSIDNGSYCFGSLATALQAAFESKTELLIPRLPRSRFAPAIIDPNSQCHQQVNACVDGNQKGKGSVSEHLCDDLSTLPSLREVDISLPSICPNLFASSKMQWSGTCLIRFSKICRAPPCGTLQDNAKLLELTLASARSLMIERTRLGKTLTIELTSGSYVFRPDEELVYGDFLSKKLALENEELGESRTVVIMTEDKMLGRVAISETNFLKAIGEGQLEL